MRRSPVALVALVAVALTVAACGGSGKSSDSTAAGTAAEASGNGDAAGILSAIDTKASTGPQKLKLDVTVDIKGSPDQRRSSRSSRSSRSTSGSTAWSTPPARALT